MTEGKSYKRGFNDGYKIAKHLPDLYYILMRSWESESEYRAGFQKAGEEYEFGERLRQSLEKTRREKEARDRRENFYDK
jgi:hypothetical protein